MANPAGSPKRQHTQKWLSFSLYKPKAFVTDDSSFPILDRDQIKRKLFLSKKQNYEHSGARYFILLQHLRLSSV